MKRLWQWLAAAGAALVALLVGVWGVVHWRGEKARLNRELDRSIEAEQRRLSEAETKLAMETERSQAALAEAHHKAAERARDGASVERLYQRLSPPDNGT